MRQSRLSGSVEGVMGNHDSYSDCALVNGRWSLAKQPGRARLLVVPIISPSPFLSFRVAELRSAARNLLLSPGNWAAKGLLYPLSYADSRPRQESNLRLTKYPLPSPPAKSYSMFAMTSSSSTTSAKPMPENPARLRAGCVGMISAILSICARVGRVRFE
jgi:hypothetical protein